jgi:anti-sigma B factor antagonist
MDDRFEVEVLPDGGTERTVLLSGEIDLASAPPVWEALESAIDDATRVVVDLSGVRFIDSTGLSLLVRAHRHLRQAGGTFIVRSPSEMAARVLNITGLDTVFGLGDETPGVEDSRDPSFLRNQAFPDEPGR